jgi:hypothetical protein
VFLAAIKALPESPAYAGKLNDTHTMQTFQKEFSAKTRELKNLLRGTPAWPLVERQEEQTQALWKAQESRDDAAVQRAVEQIKFLGNQVEKMIEQAVAAAAPAASTSQSTSSFSPAREVTLNDCDVQPEALDFETGRILVVPEEARQQLLADNTEWFVKTGVDLLTDTTPKGVGLITTSSNELHLVKLANEDWQTLPPAELSAALSRGVSGLAEDQAKHFGKVYSFLTNTPAPVTLGFRTGSRAEGILQLTRFGEGDQPPVTLRYKLVREGQARHPAATPGTQPVTQSNADTSSR